MGEVNQFNCLLNENINFSLYYYTVLKFILSNLSEVIWGLLGLRIGTVKFDFGDDINCSGPSSYHKFSTNKSFNPKVREWKEEWKIKFIQPKVFFCFTGSNECKIRVLEESPKWLILVRVSIRFLFLLHQITTNLCF